MRYDNMMLYVLPVYRTSTCTHASTAAVVSRNSEAGNPVGAEQANTDIIQKLEHCNRALEASIFIKGTDPRRDCRAIPRYAIATVNCPRSRVHVRVWLQVT